MLVVEDEFFIAEELRRSLIAAGAIVVGPVATKAEAIDQVRQDGFEIAVMDVNLRGEFAFAVADELRSHAIPFVFTTGYSQSVIPVRFKDVTRWEKPFRERELVECLATMLSVAEGAGNPT